MIRVTHSIKTPDSADEISNTPSGTISSINVQDALNELDGDLTALDASLGTAAVEDVGTSGHTLPFLDGANTWSADQSFTTGIDFGAAVAPGGATDLSRHLDLYNGQYGFSITSSSFNHVANAGASHNWYSSTTNIMTLSNTGVLTLPIVRLTATDDVSLSSTDHAFQIGPDGAANISVDSNEIQARNNGAASSLNLNVSGGSVVLGNATSQVTVAGGQLQFPATQNASSNANNLDDYEEGTFTPVIQGTTTAGAGTYSVQLGHYLKLGRFVFIMITLQWSAHTGTGNMIVSTLPFAVSDQNTPFAVEPSAIAVTAGNYLTARGSGTTIQVTQAVTGGGNLSGTPIDTAGILRISGWYMTTA